MQVSRKCLMPDLIDKVSIDPDIDPVIKQWQISWYLLSAVVWEWTWWLLTGWDGLSISKDPEQTHRKLNSILVFEINNHQSFKSATQQE